MTQLNVFALKLQHLGVIANEVSDEARGFAETNQARGGYLIAVFIVHKPRNDPYETQTRP